MGTSTLFYKYRPIRIGFLVEDGNIANVVKAAGINNLLWGGIYNPIIPISENSELAARLVKLFRPDILFSVTTNNQEIEKFRTCYPFLRSPRYSSDEIFNKDWRTKKNLVGYLDTINVIDYFWETEFKHTKDDTRSRCVLPAWQEQDNLSVLLSLVFGYFPTDYDLRHDFRKAFLTGLKANELQIDSNGVVDPLLSDAITPIKLTAAKLMGYEGQRGDGIYLGEINNFSDLVNFWNLRAIGSDLVFLPVSDSDRLRGYIEAHLERLNHQPNRHPEIPDSIVVYHGPQVDNPEMFLKDVSTKKALVYAKCSNLTWVGTKSSHYHFNWDQVLASIEKSNDRYEVTIGLPEKKFLTEIASERSKDQLLAISLTPVVEFDYPGHTLKLPPIYGLEEFFNREITFDPRGLRAGEEEITVLGEVGEKSVTLSPISHQKLIFKCFQEIGCETKLSAAGLLAHRIIDKLEGLWHSHIFRTRGLRILLQQYSPNDSIPRGEITRIINQEHRNQIRDRFDREDAPNVEGLFNALLKRRFMQAGLELNCGHCNLANWLSLRGLDENWSCQYCGHLNNTSPYLWGGKLRDRDWKYRKSGLFAKDNNQEGAIPVILCISALERILGSANFIYSFSVEHGSGNSGWEIDFCVLHYGQGRRFEIGIGEAKSTGGKIDEEDLEKLKSIREKLQKRFGVPCFLILGKTADEFRSDEIDNFRALKEKGVPFVLLSNHELERYNPYWRSEEEEAKIPNKYAHSLQEMAANSVSLYL